MIRYHDIPKWTGSTWGEMGNGLVLEPTPPCSTSPPCDAEVPESFLCSSKQDREMDNRNSTVRIRFPQNIQHLFRVELKLGISVPIHTVREGGGPTHRSQLTGFFIAQGHTVRVSLVNHASFQQIS